MTIVTGINGLPKLILSAPDGARTEIYLHGAHVTSWLPAGSNVERLFLSERSEFRAGTAIRGGVPIIFPQFAGEGNLPKHGFARSIVWELVSVETNSENNSIAKLQLHESATTQAIWASKFLAELTVVVGGSRLAMTLAITNTDDKPFTFTAALHTYLKIADVQLTQIENLGGIRYRDQAASNVERVDETADLKFKGEIDRIYFNAPPCVLIREAERLTEVMAVGFPDVVVWNPWHDKGATLADLEPEGYRRMVCVEAAVVGVPVSLEPGEAWLGTQTLVAH